METCWICHEDSPDLIRACDCTGELSMSHLTCLTEWARRQPHCRMCNAQYHVPVSLISIYAAPVILWSTTFTFLFWLRFANLSWVAHIVGASAILCYIAAFEFFSGYFTFPNADAHFPRVFAFTMGATSSLPLAMGNRWIRDDLTRAWFTRGGIFGILIRIFTALLP